MLIEALAWLFASPQKKRERLPEPPVHYPDHL